MTQDFFLLLAAPFSYLPRPIHVISVFFISALYHATFYYPLSHTFALWPYLSFFVGSGIGCALERQFYRITGKRVGGFWGAVWTWTFVLVVSIPIMDYEWSSGWAGVMRGELAKTPRMSIVEWAVWGLGMGPRPGVL